MGTLSDLGLDRISFMNTGGIMNFLMWTIGILIFLGIFGIIIYMWYQKKVYMYPVRIFRRRENGGVLEINGFGGYINRTSGAPFFRIKLGKGKKVDLTETPKLEYMDEQSRVYYNQIDIDTFIQIKRNFDIDSVKYTPVESDVKYGAILSVQRVKDTLKMESTWSKLAPYLTLALLSIVFIVAYSMLMDKCG